MLHEKLKSQPVGSCGRAEHMAAGQKQASKMGCPGTVNGTKDETCGPILAMKCSCMFIPTWAFHVLRQSKSLQVDRTCEPGPSHRWRPKPRRRRQVQKRVAFGRLDGLKSLSLPKHDMGKLVVCQFISVIGGFVQQCQSWLCLPNQNGPPGRCHAHFQVPHFFFLFGVGG